MDIEIIKDEKEELEFKLDNQTLAEILRVYLNKDEHVKLAGWRKEHYSKPLTLKIITDGKPAKKALSDAISKLKKDLNKYYEEFKKAIK